MKPNPTPTRRIQAILILSITYMFAELLGGILSGSLTLLADAGHMAIDSAGLSLGLFALWVSQKAPNDAKTYGYYRAEILAALFNGALLVALAGWLISRAIMRLSEPSIVHGETMTLIALGGLVVNLIALKTLHQSCSHNLNTRGMFLHILSDTLGSVSAVLAGILIWWKQWYLADPIISLVISAFILYGSWKLLTEAVDVLLEAVPEGINIAEIKARIESMTKVRDVHDLHVWRVGTGMVALSAHVGVESGADHADLLKAITALANQHFKIDHVTVQLDPPHYAHGQMH